MLKSFINDFSIHGGITIDIKTINGDVEINGHFCEIHDPYITHDPDEYFDYYKMKVTFQTKFLERIIGDLLGRDNNIYIIIGVSEISKCLLGIVLARLKYLPESIRDNTVFILDYEKIEILNQKPILRFRPPIKIC